MGVVVITGASSGIGEATAVHLAGEGHTLVLAARRADRLEQLAQQLGERTEVLIVPTDVADPASLERLVQAAIERFGAIDVWVNNAGIGGSSAEAERVIAVNLTAPILAAQAVLPHMLKAGRGHIINVSSVAGHVGTPDGVYSATKFGLRGYSEGLRREVRRHGIHVSMVSPGFVRSEMTQRNKFRMPGPEIIARAIGSLIRRPRREVVVPWFYHGAILLNRWLPWLADRILGPRRK